jgi:hypothetical protein
MAVPARSPKCASMNGVSQCQRAATIRTGGAEKCVSVPPMDTFTKSSPSVA